MRTDLCLKSFYFCDTQQTLLFNTVVGKFCYALNHVVEPAD